MCREKMETHAYCDYVAMDIHFKDEHRTWPLELLYSLHGKEPFFSTLRNCASNEVATLLSSVFLK